MVQGFALSLHIEFKKCHPHVQNCLAIGMQYPGLPITTFTWLVVERKSHWITMEVGVYQLGVLILFDEKLVP